MMKKSKDRKIILKGLKKEISFILLSVLNLFSIIFKISIKLLRFQRTSRKLSKKCYLRTPTYKKMLNVLKKYNDRINLLTKLNSSTFSSFNYDFKQIIFL